MSELILIRGHSGSGKTTLAEKLYDEFRWRGDSAEHFEADDFFVSVVSGEYKFNHNLLKDAHEQCQYLADEAMSEYTDHVIVANTFTRMWEMQPYLDMADKHGYDVRVVRMTGDYPNEHGVPDHVVEQQKERMEDYPNETINSL